MAALQPSVEGLPHNDSVVRSFAKVISSQSQPPFSELPDLNILDQSTSGLYKVSFAITFPMYQVDSLSHTFAWTLIAKFSQGYNKQNPKLGRPPVDDLTKYFGSLDLKGEFLISILDNRHILIKLNNE